MEDDTQEDQAEPVKLKPEKLPKDVRTAEQRKELAQELCRLIELGEDERAPIKNRWDVNRANYNGDRPGFSNRFLPGAESVHFPLVKPKSRALAANVIGTLFSQSPTCLAELQGEESDVAENLENQLEFFLDLGDLRSALEQSEGLAFTTNNAVIRTTFEASASGFAPRDTGTLRRLTGPISYCGPRFEVIDPEDFICYPKAAGSIPRAQIVGHRFYRQIWEIEELQKAGSYIDDDLSLVPTEGENDGKTVNAGSSEKEENPAECWEVVFKDDLDDLGYRRWYKATVAREGAVLLKIDEYEPSRPWYTFVRYTPADNGSCWSEYSLAQDLQGLQWEKNQIRNLMVYGSFMAAFPPITGTRSPSGRGVGATDKAQKYGPGQFINDPNARALSITFDPGQLENELERIERDADAMIGIGQAGTGSQFKPNTTATEAAYIQSSQQTGVKQFLATFGRTIVDIASLLVELLDIEYPLWSEIHAEQVKVTQEDLKRPARWSLHGSSPEMLPEVLLEKYKFLWEMKQGMTQPAGPGMPPGQSPFDDEELVRSILNQMQIPNRDKILRPKQMGPQGMEDMNGLGGLLQGAGMAPPQAAGEFGAEGMPQVPQIAGPGY